MNSKSTGGEVLDLISVELECIVATDLGSVLPQAVDPILGGLTLKGGTLTVPCAPGLGAEVEEAFLSKVRPLFYGRKGGASDCGRSAADDPDGVAGDAGARCGSGRSGRGSPGPPRPDAPVRESA
jgi:hypothetical protein